jgi:hypothetical protein
MERSFERRPTDQQLALAWHVVEFIAVLSLVGVIWSWRHLNKTAVEIDREKANRGRDL